MLSMDRMSGSQIEQSDINGEGQVGSWQRIRVGRIEDECWTMETPPPLHQASDVDGQRLARWHNKSHHRVHMD